MTHQRQNKRVARGERLIGAALGGCAGISILISVGIVAILISQSWLFFANPAVTLKSLLLSFEWQPLIGKFGIWPLLNATIITSLIAMSIALPVGFIVAVYLSEYASTRVRNLLKPTFEVLAGIPTVVYGYFAITIITPLLQSIVGPRIAQFYNMASAGIAIGILIVPMVISISEDALSGVPNSLREGGYALGASKMQISIQIVAPAAFSGIMAAAILGLSRAVGETMIVALAAGAGPNFTFNPFAAAETLTGYIVRISGGDVSYNTVDYNSIFFLGLILFLFTLGLNTISRAITRKFRQEYE